MTDCVYTGAAAKKRQTDTITIAGTWATGKQITLTIGNVDFIVTIGALTTTPQVATTLKEAFNGETLTDTTATISTYGGALVIPQFREYDAATVNGSVVTFNVTTLGKPVTMTCTEDAAGTAVLATTVTATGPAFADNPDNWSAALAHGVRLIFPAGGTQDLLYNLTLAIQPSAIIRMKGFRGKVGLGEMNTDTPQYSYPEYRTRYLTVGSNATSGTCSIDLGDGSGATRFNVDFSTLEYATTVYGSGQRLETGVPPILLKGTNANNTLTNLGGDVGFAFYPDEAGHLASVRNGTAGSPKTVVGSGVNLDDAIVSCGGGTLETNSLTTTASSVAAVAGTLILNVGNQLAVTVSKGAKLLLRNAGSTIATLKLFGGKTVKETSGAITVTNPVEFYDGAELWAEDGNLTLTGGFKTVGCELSDITFKHGENHTYTISA